MECWGIDQKNTIRSNLLKNFFLVILIAVLILEIFFIFAIHQLSIKYIENLMSENLDYAINSIIYKSDALDITEILDPNFRQYFDERNSQIQIINKDGEVIFDSLGVLYLEPIESPDVEEAQQGRTGIWRGSVDYSDDQVMAMSRPIINVANNNIGVIRMIVSLTPMRYSISRFASMSLLVGLLAILVASILSLIFSKNLTEPLKEITEVATRLADGQYKVRADVDSMVELEELSNSINHLADEVVKREEIKDDFISSVSHELRTPLTSIKGWAATLQNAGLENPKLFNEGLNIILSETDRLSDLVEDLLDFSRFSSGGISLEKEEVSLNNFLFEIYSQMNPQVLDNGHIFTVDFGMNLGSVIIDINRMKQVFINIFDNAIKFTPSPGVISFYAKRSEDALITIVIRDTGVGMSEDEVLRVKDKFYKGNLGASHVGLGLTISDEIVKLHGGRLDIESELSRGTKISIEIQGEANEEN